MREILVAETGAIQHSDGYGPVDMRGVDLSDEPMEVGTLINTPWGMIEIVAVNDRRYLALIAACRQTRPIRDREPSRLADLSDWDDD